MDILKFKSLDELFEDDDVPFETKYKLGFRLTEEDL